MGMGWPRWSASVAILSLLAVLASSQTDIINTNSMDLTFSTVAVNSSEDFGADNTSDVTTILYSQHSAGTPLANSYSLPVTDISLHVSPTSAVPFDTTNTFEPISTPDISDYLTTIMDTASLQALTTLDPLTSSSCMSNCDHTSDILPSPTLMEYSSNYATNQDFSSLLILSDTVDTTAEISGGISQPSPSFDLFSTPVTHADSSLVLTEFNDLQNHRSISEWHFIDSAIMTSVPQTSDYHGYTVTADLLTKNATISLFGTNSMEANSLMLETPSVELTMSQYSGTDGSFSFSNIEITPLYVASTELYETQGTSAESSIDVHPSNMFLDSDAFFETSDLDHMIYSSLGAYSTENSMLFSSPLASYQTEIIPVNSQTFASFSDEIISVSTVITEDKITTVFHSEVSDFPSTTILGFTSDLVETSLVPSPESSIDFNGMSSETLDIDPSASISFDLTGTSMEIIGITPSLTEAFDSNLLSTYSANTIPNPTSTEVPTDIRPTATEMTPIMTASFAVWSTTDFSVEHNDTIMFNSTETIAIGVSTDVVTEAPVPSTEWMLNISEAYEEFWVKTVLQVELAEDVSTYAFRYKMESKLSAVYDEAIERYNNLFLGNFVPRRRKRAVTVGNATIQMTNITRTDPDPTHTTLVYYLIEDYPNNITAADRTVGLIEMFSDQELAIKLGYPVILKGEVYLPPPPPKDKRLWIIGAVLGSIAGFLFLLWLALFIYCKCTRAPKRPISPRQRHSRVSDMDMQDYRTKDVKGFDYARTAVGMEAETDQKVQDHYRRYPPGPEYEGMYAPSPAPSKDSRTHPPSNSQPPPAPPINGFLATTTAAEVQAKSQPKTASKPKSKTKPRRSSEDTEPSTVTEDDRNKKSKANHKPHKANKGKKSAVESSPTTSSIADSTSEPQRSRSHTRDSDETSEEETDPVPKKRKQRPKTSAHKSKEGKQRHEQPTTAASRQSDKPVKKKKKKKQKPEQKSSGATEPTGAKHHRNVEDPRAIKPVLAESLKSDRYEQVESDSSSYELNPDIDPDSASTNEKARKLVNALLDEAFAMVTPGPESQGNTEPVMEPAPPIAPTKLTPHPVLPPAMEIGPRHTPMYIAPVHGNQWQPTALYNPYAAYDEASNIKPIENPQYSNSLGRGGNINQQPTPSAHLSGPQSYANPAYMGPAPNIAPAYMGPTTSIGPGRPASSAAPIYDPSSSYKAPTSFDTGYSSGPTYKDGYSNSYGDDVAYRGSHSNKAHPSLPTYDETRVTDPMYPSGASPGDLENVGRGTAFSPYSRPDWTQSIPRAWAGAEETLQLGSRQSAHLQNDAQTNALDLSRYHAHDPPTRDHHDDEIDIVTEAMKPEKSKFYQSIRNEIERLALNESHNAPGSSYA